MAKYGFSFNSTTLDILFDQTRNRYVQRVGGIKNSSDNPHQMISCIDLIDGSFIDYKISEFDVIEEQQVSARTIFPKLRERVYRINEGVRVTGRIVERVA